MSYKVRHLAYSDAYFQQIPVLVDKQEVAGVVVKAAEREVRAVRFYSMGSLRMECGQAPELEGHLMNPLVSVSPFSKSERRPAWRGSFLKVTQFLMVGLGLELESPALLPSASFFRASHGNNFH